jgi:hypothetical protein
MNHLPGEINAIIYGYLTDDELITRVSVLDKVRYAGALQELERRVNEAEQAGDWARHARLHDIWTMRLQGSNSALFPTTPSYIS